LENLPAIAEVSLGNVRNAAISPSSLLDQRLRSFVQPPWNPDWRATAPQE
jgi:hypothetical protein